MSIESLIVTDAEGWLDESLDKCTKSLLVVSPFVSEYAVPFFTRLGPHVNKTLITRFDIGAFATRASSVKALQVLSADHVLIYALCRLHAKAYVIDNRALLITSANATMGGMRTNLECGVAMEDTQFSERFVRLLWNGFGSGTYPDLVDIGILLELERSMQYIRIEQAPPLDASAADLTVGSSYVKITSVRSFVSSLGGWKGLVLEGVLGLSQQVFTLAEAYNACHGAAQQQYPDNLHVEEKIRQQLQVLRDMGIIEFLGDGNYKLLVTPDA